MHPEISANPLYRWDDDSKFVYSNTIIYGEITQFAIDVFHLVDELGMSFENAEKEVIDRMVC